jgi:hypothetical protein
VTESTAVLYFGISRELRCRFYVYMPQKVFACGDKEALQLPGEPVLGKEGNETEWVQFLSQRPWRRRVVNALELK